MLGPAFADFAQSGGELKKIGIHLVAGIDRHAGVNETVHDRIPGNLCLIRSLSQNYTHVKSRVGLGLSPDG